MDPECEWILAKKINIVVFSDPNRVLWRACNLTAFIHNSRRNLSLLIYKILTFLLFMAPH
jgi:hypothetical protein